MWQQMNPVEEDPDPGGKTARDTLRGGFLRKARVRVMMGPWEAEGREAPRARAAAGFCREAA